MNKYPDNIFVERDPLSETILDGSSVTVQDWEEEREKEIYEILNSLGYDKETLDSLTPLERNGILMRRKGEEMNYLTFPEQTR